MDKENKHSKVRHSYVISQVFMVLVGVSPVNGGQCREPVLTAFSRRPAADEDKRRPGDMEEAQHLRATAATLSQASGAERALQQMFVWLYFMQDLSVVEKLQQLV